MYALFLVDLFDRLAPVDPALVIYPGCACADLTNTPVEIPTRIPVVYPFLDLCKSTFR